jgi:hypothetical protein
MEYCKMLAACSLRNGRVRRERWKGEVEGRGGRERWKGEVEGRGGRERCCGIGGAIDIKGNDGCGSHF